jgi:hypothetical protein
MPFSLTNAPATFQTYINRTLRGYIDDFYIVYLDDILIFSQNEEQHQQYLDLVLERLRQFELYANPSKCSFNQKEVEYLRFIINTQNVRMDPSRVQIVEAWRTTPPKTYRDIQVFLRFCNFYHRFIYSFSHITKPLHNLIKGIKNGRKPDTIDNDW